MRELLKKLNSRNADVRSAALREARALPMEQLLELAALEARRYPKWLRKLDLLTYNLFLIALSLMSGYTMLAELHGSTRPTAVILIQLSIFSAFAYGLTTFACGFLPNRARAAVASLIADLHDPRFVGPVLTLLQADAKTMEKGGLRQSLREALKWMLPKLRAGDAALLTPEQRRILLLLLDKPMADPELTLCILKALEQIGDEQAVPAVQKLIDRLAGYTSKRAASLREAAQECLPYLTGHVERTRQAQTLLRPADSSQAVSADVLLRPSLPTVSETPSEQLLRPPASECVIMNRS